MFFPNSKSQAHKITEGESGVIVYRSKYTFIDEYIPDTDPKAAEITVMDPDQYLKEFSKHGYEDF